VLRIYYDYAAKKLPFGNVHFYILTPDAEALDGISVNGLTVELFAALLEKTIRNLQLKPGDPVVKPSPQSTPSPRPSDSLVFHLIARGSRVGSYREFPSENWIVLGRDEGLSLLPSGAVQPGATWAIEKKVAAKFLIKFYPQSVEVNTAERSRIDEYSLKATVLSVEDNIACARLDGTLIMKRSWSPGADDNNFVRATLLGFINFDPKLREFQALRLVTTKAIYGAGPNGDDGALSNDEAFSAVLRSMSPQALQQYLGQP